MTTSTANVALVGAGPGAPDLITVRGLRLLQQAEVVVHDRLVSPQLLLEAQPSSERINVGKAPHRNRFPQADINKILIDQARSGKRVVRLKGGDPFVFGLGSSEALSLAQAGIPFEVVPGVSSAIALTGLAGIPLTMKNQLTSFTVLSGHYPPGHAKAADFDNLPNDGTVVVLMGRRHLEAITKRLMHRRWPADTPVALIASGTTTDEQIRTTTLEQAAAEAATLSAPLTIAIGNGVSFRSQVLQHLCQRRPAEQTAAWGQSREVER